MARSVRRRPRRVTQPALVVLGARSNEVNTTFAQRNELLLAWLPDAEPFVLPDATHLLQVEQPGAMARGLAAFLARHPIKPGDDQRCNPGAGRSA